MARECTSCGCPLGHGALNDICHSCSNQVQGHNQPPERDWDALFDIHRDDLLNERDESEEDDGLL